MINEREYKLIYNKLNEIPKSAIEYHDNYKTIKGEKNCDISYTITDHKYARYNVLNILNTIYHSNKSKVYKNNHETIIQLESKQNNYEMYDSVSINKEKTIITKRHIIIYTNARIKQDTTITLFY